MDSIIQSIPEISAYKCALTFLALVCLSVLIQSFLTAPLAYAKQEQVPGLPLIGDHQLFSFRVVRAYSNSVENLPAFGFSLIIAIVVGVNASLVNWAAAIYFIFRMAFWIVYYSGVGKIAGGPRSLCYIGGLVTNIVLVCACLYALMIS